MQEPMPENTFERRGKKTLVLMLIFRLTPAFFILIAVIAFASIRGQVIESLGSVSTDGSVDPETIYSYLLQTGFWLFIIVAGVTTLITLLDYYGLSFSINENSFRLREGIINIREQSLAYRQIQNIDIARPLLYRLAGLSKVVILTAGTEDHNHSTVNTESNVQSEAIIDFIDKEKAEKLQHELLERSHVQVIRNTPLPAIDLHTN